ncbi:hypothetical protein M408DRAFT_14236 [Serendipita vermifera MAFF 305830]|uniref:Uncharacterized protein n=1 Tax=Serendipita vermifera MAFF 305830 TaxID=933852 RepID=A0A0C3BN65_SERVB|nr:hypothetical protein M408DRAFT_14236 [Serendipita vermifera MAFF 305830]
MRKSVLITGCSHGGAGNQLAKEYCSRGLHVFATARNIEAMNDLDLPGITRLELDVTNIESIRTARDQVKSILGVNTGLDLLVNNAGIWSTTPALDHELSEIRSIFETNVFGMMAMVQEFMPLLTLSQDACIVNVGSIGGLMPYAFGSTYNASKAAVHSYSDTLRLELRPLGIQVITVILGGVKTNIFTRPPKPLPDNSYYRPIEAIFRGVRSGQVHKATPRDKFAREFVDATLRPSTPRHLALAFGSIVVPWVTWLVPGFLINFRIVSNFGAGAVRIPREAS